MVRLIVRRGVRVAAIFLPPALLFALLCGGCEPVRELVLASVLPEPCVAGPVNELRVRGLGDFPPSASFVDVLDVSGELRLDLPRDTRVVTIEGAAPGGLVAFGRTAPMELPTAWDDGGAAHLVPIAYGAPDTFCATARMRYPRSGHRATLLEDGSVLITGGYNPGGFAEGNVERYLPKGDADSAIARFVPVDPKVSLSERQVLGHQATRLEDGRVFISGGSPVEDGLANGASEAALWLGPDGASTGPPRFLEGGPRAFHADVRLPDGRVLLTGGCKAFEVGQCPDQNLLASVMIYDPASDTFAVGFPLIAGRAGHRALVRDDGLVLIVGGRGAGGIALAPELYDPSEARGSVLAGPSGIATMTSSGLLVSVNDAAGPSARAVAWSGRDEVPVVLPQLPSAISEGTVTALEDDTVLVAGGGGDKTSFAQTSVVVGPGRPSTALSGFVGRGHTATLLLDGTVLLAGGIDANGEVSDKGALFMRSLAGPFDTPATLAFEGPSLVSPSRPDRVTVADGVLTIDAGTPARTPEAFALVSGPLLAGPAGAGFEVSVLVGRQGSAEVALLFGDPGRGQYLCAALSVGAPARLLGVRPDRPGLLAVEELSDCTTEIVGGDELPDNGYALLTMSGRHGRIELRSETRTILSCAPAADRLPQRGRVALGALAGRVRYDNAQLER